MSENLYNGKKAQLSIIINISICTDIDFQRQDVFCKGRVLASLTSEIVL